MPRVRLSLLFPLPLTHTHCASLPRVIVWPVFLVSVTGINKDRFDPTYRIVSLSPTPTTTTQSHMPMRPEKRLAELASTVPRLDPEPSNTCLDNQSPPSQTPPGAEPNQAPRRATQSQKPFSLVVRNTRTSRNKTSYTPIPRSNHYLLAKSLVENEQPPKPPAPERRPRATRKTASSLLCHEAFPPDFTISNFIWRFSTPDPDSQIHDAFATLESYDPQTFSELIAGLD